MIAHSVSDRRSELGVRIALGASALNVLATVARHGARPALAGLGAGIIAALIASRWLAASVYGVSWSEPGLLAAVLGLTTLVSLTATYLAARRALAIQPTEAMRGV